MKHFGYFKSRKLPKTTKKCNIVVKNRWALFSIKEIQIAHLKIQPDNGVSNLRVSIQKLFKEWAFYILWEHFKVFKTTTRQKRLKSAQYLRLKKFIKYAHEVFYENSRKISKHTKGAFGARETLQNFGMLGQIGALACFVTSASCVVERNIVRI